MSRKYIGLLRERTSLSLVALVIIGVVGSVTIAQQFSKPASFYQDAGEGYQKVEMSVGTSRVLTFEYDIPKVIINDGTVTAKPVSPNQIMLQAMQPGIASIYVHNANGDVQPIDVVVLADTRPLREALDSLFPEAQVNVRPLNSTVALTGYASSTEQVKQIMEVARDYFPSALNQLQVDGNYKVLLNAKVFEVSRTKLRQIGVDWAAILSGDFIISNPGNSLDLQSFFSDGSAGGNSTVIGGVVDGNNQFTVLLDLLEQNNMAKILADTQLVADSGRAASLLSGGEVPIPISNGFATSIDFREFGTSLDCVPIVQADGLIRLEMLTQVRDVAGDLRDSVTGTPGFRTRSVNTAVTIPAGRTIAIAGIIQNRSDTEVRGIPYLMDMPWVGGLFRRSVETFNEVDLVVIIRPEFVGSVDPVEMPEGPGRATVLPNDTEFYLKGYIEVPSCCPTEELGPVLPFEATPPEMIEPRPAQESPSPLLPPKPGSEAPASGDDLSRYPYGAPDASLTSQPRLRFEKLPGTKGTGIPISLSSPKAESPTTTSRNQIVGPAGYDRLPK
jgi:pilus assembly protein CpaC